MDNDIKYKKAKSFISRPWFIESLFFFLVLGQESFRLSARTSHKVLPISSSLQNYYYFNFGDFVNGFVMAFIIDGLVNLTLLKSTGSFKLLSIEITIWKSALFATLLSSAIVVAFELTHSASTTSDVKDIPAGVAGAFVYYLVRLLALRINEKHDSHLR